MILIFFILQVQLLRHVTGIPRLHHIYIFVLKVAVVKIIVFDCFYVVLKTNICGVFVIRVWRRVHWSSRHCPDPTSFRNIQTQPELYMEDNCQYKQSSGIKVSLVNMVFHKESSQVLFSQKHRLKTRNVLRNILQCKQSSLLSMVFHNVPSQVLFFQKHTDTNQKCAQKYLSVQIEQLKCSKFSKHNYYPTKYHPRSSSFRNRQTQPELYMEMVNTYKRAV